MLPTWFLVVSILLVVAGAAYLGFALLKGTDDPADAAPTASATPSVPTTPVVTPEPSETTPEPTPEPSVTTPPPVERTASVAIFNNTSTSGLAATFSARVQAEGWTVAGVGNWRGSIPSNTVYYPADLEEQGRLLAADLGIGRVMPAVDPMRTDRLTLVLSGPQ